MPKVCPVCGASYADAIIFCPTDGSSLRAAEADGDLIGTVLADRYLVTDLLGEGGMGKVYLARHVRLPQQAAIKVLRPAMLRDPAAVARFNREAANASRIEHEHIARVFDYGESADGTVYLAMEYVPGRTLKSIVSTAGAMAPARAAALTRQIGMALDAAHRLGIVHRDLKPDNVMVIEDPDTGDRCKVVDFGIAKAVGGDAGEAGLTKTGFVVGTPEFMSPEQLLGDAIDHRSDVYALALLSFQCLTGALPFDSTTPERAMTARLVDTPRSLATVMPQVAWPDDVQSVFNRGLARDVNARFESAGAFARALESAVSRWREGGGAAPALDSAAPTVAAWPAHTDSPPSGGPNASSYGSPAIASASAAKETDEARAADRPAAASNTSAPGSPGAARHTTAASQPIATTSAIQEPARGRGLLVAAALVGLIGLSAVGYLLTNRSESDGDASSTTPLLAEETRSEASTMSEQSAPNPPAGEDAETSTVEQTYQDTKDALPSQQSAVTSKSASTILTPPGNAGRTTAQSANPPAASSSGPDAARLELDSLRIALDPLTATPAEARRGVAALRELMPRLTTAEDSVWALIRQAEAHFIMVDQRSACVAIKAATPLATNSRQRAVLEVMTGSLSDGC